MIVGRQRRARVDQLARALARFAVRLARPRHVAATHAAIIRTIARHCGARTGSLTLYDEQEAALVICATHGYPLVLVEDRRIQPGDGVLGRAFLDGRAHIGDAGAHGRRRYRTSSYMVLPLHGPQGIAAVLALTDRQGSDVFTPADLARATLFASIAELGLDRQAASAGMEEARRLAAIDPVTGLFTRRHLEERLAAEVQRAARHGDPLSMLLIDVDDFKRVNDEHGHLAGDRTLQALADVVRDSVRIFDVCARYGGDELIILMPRATVDVAVGIADRLRRRVEERFAGDPAPITISLGAASLRPGAGASDLIATADRRLRAAKQKGKNALNISD